MVPRPEFLVCPRLLRLSGLLCNHRCSVRTAALLLCCADDGLRCACQLLPAHPMLLGAGGASGLGRDSRQSADHAESERNRFLPFLADPDAAVLLALRGLAPLPVVLETLLPLGCKLSQGWLVGLLRFSGRGALPAFLSGLSARLDSPWEIEYGLPSSSFHPPARVRPGRSRGIRDRSFRRSRLTGLSEI